MPVHTAHIENVRRKFQHPVPQRTRPDHCAFFFILDLPIEAAQGLRKARIGQGAVEGDIACRAEGNAGGDLADIGIELGLGAPFNMALKQPGNSQSCKEKGQHNADSAKRKEPELERSGLHGSCAAIR